ncbi:unnamed protein product [[Candida] boidinii]|nr:unnamed protein product [[Candida] boidinii]
MVFVFGSRGKSTSTEFQSASAIASDPDVQSAIITPQPTAADITNDNDNDSHDSYSCFNPPMTSHVINGSPGYGRVSHLQLLKDPYTSLKESEFQLIDATKNGNGNGNDNHINIKESNTDAHISETSDSFEDTCDEASSSSHYSNNDSHKDVNGANGNGQFLSPNSGLPPKKMKEYPNHHTLALPRPASEWIRDIKNSQAHTRFGHMLEVIDTPKEQTTLCPSPSSKRTLAINPGNNGGLQYVAPFEGTSLTGSPTKRTGKSVRSRFNTQFPKLEPLKYDDFNQSSFR